MSPPHWRKAFLIVVHGSMYCDQKNLTLVRRWHQFLSGSLPYDRLSRVSHRLLARPRTFDLARMLLPVSMEHELQSKRLYPSVAVTPASVRLSPVSHRLSVRPRTFHFASYFAFNVLTLPEEYWIGIPELQSQRSTENNMEEDKNMK